MRRTLLRLSVLLFVFGAGYAGLSLLLSSQKSRVVNLVEQTLQYHYGVEIEHLGLSGILGVEATGIVLSPRGDTALDPERNPTQLKRVELLIPLQIPWGELTFQYRVEQGEGFIEGRMTRQFLPQTSPSNTNAPRRYGHRVTAQLQEFPVGDVPIFADIFGAPLRGALSGQADMLLDGPQLLRAHLDLTLQNGALLPGPTRTPVGVVELPSALLLGHGRAVVTTQKQRLVTQQLSLQGPLVNLKGEGFLPLGQNPRRAPIRGKLKVQFSSELFTALQSPSLGLALAQWHEDREQLSARAEKLAFKLHQLSPEQPHTIGVKGTLSKPRLSIDVPKKPTSAPPLPTHSKRNPKKTAKRRTQRARP